MVNFNDPMPEVVTHEDAILLNDELMKLYMDKKTIESFALAAVGNWLKNDCGKNWGSNYSEMTITPKDGVPLRNRLDCASFCVGWFSCSVRGPFLLVRVKGWWCCTMFSHPPADCREAPLGAQVVLVGNCRSKSYSYIYVCVSHCAHDSPSALGWISWPTSTVPAFQLTSTNIQRSYRCCP